MKRFEISMDNIEKLLTTIVEASSKEEAVYQYIQKWEDGDILVSDNSLTNIQIKEVNYA